LRAESIVTGDRKHLLPNGSHQGIAIVATREVVYGIEAKLKTLGPEESRSGFARETKFARLSRRSYDHG
jgi:hypothetical protein